MDPQFSLTLALIFAGFWVFSAAHKFKNLTWFRNVLENYEVFPKLSITLLSVLVPVFEFSIGLLLLTLPQVGALLSVALLLIYAILLAFNGLRGVELEDCGCNWGQSVGQNISHRPSITRNIILAGTSLLIMIPTNERVLTYADWGNAVLASLAFTGLAVVGIYIYANRQRMKVSGYV